jgi:hypothetical protein
VANTEALAISDLNASLVRKAIEDSGFRAQLVADPKAAVEKVLNTQLPAGISLKVVEASANEFTIVLPYEAKTSADGELSDADLESVAGGSKSGAKNFFNGVGNYITHNPLTIGSAVGGAVVGAATMGAAGTAVGLGCKAASAATGQH